MTEYFRINIKNFMSAPFSAIGEKGMLITSGTKDKFNTMTASWGGLGTLWNKDVSFVFVRPQRYTYEFMETNDLYTMSFFNAGMKNVLSICGSKSGRDFDKVSEAGITPRFENGYVYFDEAEIVIMCRKIYAQFIDPACAIDKTILGNYKENDYHKVYVGEVTQILKRVD